VVLLGATSLWPFTSQADGEQPAGSVSDWFRVEERSFDLALIVTGELESRNKTEVKCRVGGNTRILEVIEEGTIVNEGDVLAKLADEELTDKIAQEELAVEGAKADLANSEQTLAIKKSEAESKLREAELKLAMAILELAKWTDGDVVQKRRDLQLELETAERNLVRAERDLELSRQLYDEKFISLGEVEDDEIKVIEAQNKLASAKLDIDVYERFTYPKEKQKFSSDVEQAEEELERTKQKNESEVARAEADLLSKQRKLRIRSDKLEELEEQLVNTVVKAPKDGMVVYATSVGPHWMRRNPIVEGRQVRWDEKLFLLPDTREMVASVRVHEASLPQVQIDQTVRVTLDAQPDQVFEAKVLSVAVMAEDGGWLNPDLREYKVQAALPTGIPDLKPAMRCTAEIVTGRVEDQLAVPVHAVFTEGDQRLVYVKRIGGVERRTITVGRANESYVEVLDGLESGDWVLLREPQPQEVVG